jgi:hypothetical protein
VVLPGYILYYVTFARRRRHLVHVHKNMGPGKNERENERKR